MLDKLLKRLTDVQIEWIRERIHRYPNKGPYGVDQFWRHVLCPVTRRLYVEQNRREATDLSHRYREYRKRLYRGQMLFHGPDGIPRSACYGAAKREADRIMAYNRSS